MGQENKPTMQSTTALDLEIKGMHCDACVKRVTNALATVPGVSVEQVKVGSATVHYDASKSNPSAIAAAVDAIGFEVSKS